MATYPGAELEAEAELEELEVSEVELVAGSVLVGWAEVGVAPGRQEPSSLPWIVT